MANFNFNKVMIGGRLTADPENSQTTSGISMTRFSVAVNRRFAKDSSQQQTDFFNVTAWRATADFVSKYFKKGSSIFVTGSLQTRSWTDQNGQKRYATEVIVDEVNFVDSASENRASSEPSYNPYGEAPAFSSTKDEAPKFEQMVDDDDLPF